MMTLRQVEGVVWCHIADGKRVVLQFNIGTWAYDLTVHDETGNALNVPVPVEALLRLFAGVERETRGILRDSPGKQAVISARRDEMDEYARRYQAEWDAKVAGRAGK